MPTTPRSNQQESPYLEYGPDGAAPQRYYLESLPFVIGRNEDVDLPIELGRVSREHAHIIRDGEAYRLEDLNSTNGTCVNGKRIVAAQLNSGDLISVADQELTFCVPSEAASGAVPTQVMTLPAADSHAELIGEVVRTVRRLQETLLQCSMRITFQPVVNLESNSVFGYEAAELGTSFGPQADQTEQKLAAMDSRMAERLRQMLRMVAVEKTLALPHPVHLFMKLHAVEIGSSDLLENVQRLHSRVSGPNQIVVELHSDAVSDIPYFREFCTQLRGAGILIAYDGLTESSGRLLEQEQFAPDFLRLDRSLFHGIDDSRRQKLEAVLNVCRHLKCEVIATGIQTAGEARACCELGCVLATGNYFGPPDTLPRPVELAAAH